MRSGDENRSDTPRGGKDAALLEKHEEERRPVCWRRDLDLR